MMQINIKQFRNFICFNFLIIASSMEIVAQEKTTLDHSITVFVHGTYPARKVLEKSFCRFLLYCPQGLSLAKNLPANYHFYKMAQGCVKLNPASYSLDQFYVFGWESEHLYDHVRMQAAEKLIQELQTIVNRYHKKHNVIPKIRLLGFSHGGNVVLHTANYLPFKIDGQVVDVEIWLFGTPVQKKNKHLVNSTNFARVYSFYSKKDWLQRMDPQGLRSAKKDFKNIWSDRMFNLSDRCIQVDFTVNGKSISHTYYRSIFKYFPIIQEIAQQKSQGIHCGCIKVDLKK